jgi:hypothetical protein
MEIQTPYENYFAILRGGKGIPYGSGARSEGTFNHGFRPLKGKLSEIDVVPEAIEDSALRRLLEKINGQDTRLFSVGCMSADVDDDPQGKRVTGYIEFALNEKSFVSDPIPYFEIFFHFTQRLANQKFTERVRFNWELLGATFCDAACDGFTCRVIINTSYHVDRQEARTCWEKSLNVLGDHLAEIRGGGTDRIY